MILQPTFWWDSFLLPSRQDGRRPSVCLCSLIKKKKKSTGEKNTAVCNQLPCRTAFFFSTITVAFLTIFCPCWDRLADISLILNLLHSHQLIVQNCAEPVKDLDASQQIWSPNFLEAISPSFWGSAKSTFWGWTESRGCGCQEYYVGRSETGDNELESCHAKVMSVAHRKAGGLRINRKWQKTAKQTNISHRTERTRLKEWALMCLTIIEDTSETFHSALGSSGRFLEGKRERLVISQVAVLGVFCGGMGDCRSSAENQEQSAK